MRKETGELRKLQTEAESAGQLAQDLLAPVQAGAKARVGKTVLDLESLAFEDPGVGVESGSGVPTTAAADQGTRVALEVLGQGTQGAQGAA